MSTSNELNLLARRVLAMRDAQREYFRAIATARKSRAGHDWKKSSDALRHAKDLEALVDHQVCNILKPNEQPTGEWVAKDEQLEKARTGVGNIHPPDNSNQTSINNESDTSTRQA